MLTKAIPLRRMLLIFLLASLVGIQSLNVMVFAASTDLNEDGVVDMEDVLIVVEAYGSYLGDPEWDPRADLNNDVSVDMLDVTLVAKDYGKNSSSKLSISGGHSPNWSSEEMNRIYQGLIEPPDIFVSNLWWASEIPNIHRKYPQKKIIIYRNLRIIDRSRTQEWANKAEWYRAEYEFARQNNLICKDPSGNYVYSKTYGRTHLLADIGNPKWQQFVANWIKFYINNFGFDGVFLDNGLGSTEPETYWGVSAKPINPRTGNYYTNDEIVLYYKQVHRKIRETIGNDKLIICNGIFHGERFFRNQQGYLQVLNQDAIDGFTSEGIFGGIDFWGEEMWRQSVEFIKWIQDKWLTRGKIFIPHINWHIPEIPTSYETVWLGFEDGCSLERCVTFHFASILLGIEAKVSESNFFSLYGCWYKPFVQELYSLDLGEPTTDYFRIENKHVYMRKFQNGLVIVNPTTTSYTVSLNKNYKTPDGRILSSFTIRQHQGVILLNG